MREWDWEIPGHWTRKTLGDIATWGSGGTPKATEASYYGGDIPWLVIGDLNDGVVTLSAKTITEAGLENSSTKYVEPGSIMVAMYGSIGKLGIAGIRCTTNQAIAFTREISDEVEPKYLFHYLASVRDLLLAEGKGGAQANISQTVLKQIPVCYPSRPEQQKIAAKLDHIAAHLEDTRARLETIPTILKRFRMSVLAAACSGRLTEEWRLKQGLEAEWDELILGDIGAVSGGITKNGKRTGLSLQVPYLRVANVYQNRLELDDIATIGVTQAEYQRTLLQPGDILVVEGNGSIDQIGRVAIWGDEVQGCTHQNHLIKFRAGSMVLPRYVLLWLMSPQGRELLTSQATSTSGLHTLSISKISGIGISLPSLVEQTEIVRRVGEMFNQAEAIETRYDKAKKFTNKLMPSVLAKAFRGELA